MQLYFMTQKPLDNEELFQLSLRVEPRGLDPDTPLPAHPCPHDERGRPIELQSNDDDAESNTTSERESSGSAVRGSEKRRAKFMPKRLVR